MQQAAVVVLPLRRISRKAQRLVVLIFLIVNFVFLPDCNLVCHGWILPSLLPSLPFSSRCSSGSYSSSPSSFSPWILRDNTEDRSSASPPPPPPPSGGGLTTALLATGERGGGTAAAFSVDDSTKEKKDQKEKKKNKQSRSSLADPSSAAALERSETPAGIEGAQFFGGKKEKADLYDPAAEAAANTVASAASAGGGSDETKYYDRFADRSAFSDGKAASLARSLQRQINAVLYDDDDDDVATDEAVAAAVLATYDDDRDNDETDHYYYGYAPAAAAAAAGSSSFVWETPFSSSGDTTTTTTTHPLLELEKALDFYRRVDVAITSARRLLLQEEDDDDDDATTCERFRVRWEISLAWPIFWEPRVLITGTSDLTTVAATTTTTMLAPTSTSTLDKTTQSDETQQQQQQQQQQHRREIVRQVDCLDDPDLFHCIRRQVVPRFWDVYHIGMTPSSELSPTLRVVTRNAAGGFLSPYTVVDVPPRLVLQPVRLDGERDRENSNAACIPNHAFCCNAIKTMGPGRQRYVPVSPVEVQLVQQQTTTGRGDGDGDGDGEKMIKLQWNVPVSVEFLTRQSLPLPGQDAEAEPGTEPACTYRWQDQRRVAIIPFGGSGGSGPQDPAVTEYRKRLYEAVQSDGTFEPKLVSGRPVFSYWQNAVKACYTVDGGLGMVVYEWRPAFTKPDHIVMELEP